MLSIGARAVTAGASCLRPSRCVPPWRGPCGRWPRPSRCRPRGGTRAGDASTTATVAVEALCRPGQPGQLEAQVHRQAVVAVAYVDPAHPLGLVQPVVEG